MRKLDIREKLEELGTPVSSLSLGDFDAIGEYTAKKTRGHNSDLYKSVGCFFRPNYERGLLIYTLIRKFKLTSFLEICAYLTLGSSSVTLEPSKHTQISIVLL